jgi:hypothetical protein
VTRVFAYLFRFAAIVIGYAVAALAASAFLNVVMLGLLAAASEGLMAARESLVFTIPFVALFIAYFAFIPAAAAILAGEILGKRDWLFYALGGAVAAGAVIGFARNSAETGSAAVADVNVALAAIGAGMCGGIAYWLVVGRTAGNWRQDPSGATSPAP